jgi:hypothetical protein
METILRELHEIQTRLALVPSAVRILEFLIAHPDARDTAEGIAEWWLQCDPEPVREVIDRLVAHGLLEAYPFFSGTVYGLTRDADLRQRLLRGETSV